LFNICKFLVQTLVTYAGERFDFIVKADQPKDVYWMHFRGLMDCDERFTKAYQVAVLQYKDVEQSYPLGEPNYDNSEKDGMVKMIFLFYFEYCHAIYFSK
jgi:L-ascorbate oxidase